MAVWASIYVALGFIVCIIVTLSMLRRYANSEVGLDAKITVFMGWYFTFSIVFLLPLELKADSDIEEKDALAPIYNTIYWTSFVLTWAIIPLQQMYALSGHFDVRSRIKESAIVNAKFYLVALLAFVAVMIYIAAVNKIELESIPGIVIGLANLWGLGLAVFMLGYGLVEVPRKLWRSSSVHKRFGFLMYKTSSLHNDKGDAEDELEETVALLRKAESRAADQFPREFAIMNALNPENELRPPRSRDAGKNDDLWRSVSQQDIDVNLLATIHARLKLQVFNVKRLRRHYSKTLQKSVNQELLVEHTDAEGAGTFTHRCGQQYVPYMRKGLAAVMVAMSLLLIFSETMLAINPELSPFNVLSRAERHRPAVVLFGFIGFCYMNYCAIFALFRIRLAQFYHMHPERGTDANSLLFNASYTLRLIFPLGYNFLQIFDNELRDSTAFGRLLGPMEDVGIIDSANSILPFLILLLTTLTALNLYSKMLGKLGLRTSFYSGREDDETAEAIKDGKLLLQRAKRKGDIQAQQTWGARSKWDRFRTSFYGLLGNQGEGHQQLADELSMDTELSNRRMDDSPSTGSDFGRAALGGGVDEKPPARRKKPKAAPSGRYDFTAIDIDLTK